jgi:hypothetical protein
MSLELFKTLEQGSDEWLAARCGLLTASTIGKLITPKLQVADNETSRGLIETLVAERITGHIDPIYPNADMQRGTLDEPYARDLYAEEYAPVTEIGFAVRTINGYRLGASPDGLVRNLGGIEIKSRSPKLQLKTILTGEIPAANLAQIHACLFVLQRDWWDYCSYAGGWPLFVKRVHRDPRWDAVITDALEKFEEDAALMIATYTSATAGSPVAPRIDHFAEIEISL